MHPAVAAVPRISGLVPTPADGPLSAAEFAAAMAALGSFECRPAIAVGVSGGPDSMALALLLADWVAARGGQLLALVVDHQLRPESAAEAALVAARLAHLGIDSSVLTRDGGMPASGLQAMARDARYRLLETATAAAGFLHLAVAHHGADQRETVALRRSSGSGGRGQAGMAAVRELDRVRLIRPLLDVEPARLRAVLEERGQAWIEDPSNRDPRFWRGRFRRDVDHIANAGRDEDDSLLAARAASARQAMDHELAVFLAAHARPSPFGLVEVAAAPLLAAPGALVRAVLARSMLATSGAVWPPGRAKLTRLVAWLHQGGSRRTALGGVFVERRPSTFRFVREPRAVAAPADVPADGMLWDGRFRIDPGHAGAGLRVRAAGPGWPRRLRATGAVGTLPPAVVLATLPLVLADSRPLTLGPWSFGAPAGGPRIVFRPAMRHTAIPHAHSPSRLVASQP